MASLVFKTKIKGDTLRSRKLKNLEGKSVKVIVIEISAKNKKKWITLASFDLGGKLDNINIRDFAYE
jgi:hypothetical protein